jgi:hypothetical protein
MWGLLLVLSTVFCAPPAIQPVVRQTLATFSFGENKAIAQIAQIAYLRFLARCQSGTPMRAPSAEFVDAIPTHVDECHYTFGASLFELLWQQRKALPELKIPIFIHSICSALIARGAFDRKGVFKAVGNQKVIEKLCDDIDNGRDVLGDADLTTLASVFKRWLGMLPLPLVPVEVYPRLLEQHDAKGFVQVADELPRIYRDALAYFIGFLKEFVMAEERTEMGVRAVSMMFGTIIVRPGNFNPVKIKELYESSRDFIANLIQAWDVSDIYPLEGDYAL